MRYFDVTLRDGKKVFGTAREVCAALDLQVASLKHYAYSFRRGDRPSTKRIANIVWVESTEKAAKEMPCDEDCFNCKFKDCIWDESKKTPPKNAKRLPRCPFCGAEAKIEVFRGKKRTHYRVFCSETERCGVAQRMFDNEDEAIAAWERRVNAGQAD